MPPESAIIIVPTGPRGPERREEKKMVYRTIDIYTDEECCVLIEERVLNEYGEYEWKVNDVI